MLKTRPFFIACSMFFLFASESQSSLIVSDFSITLSVPSVPIPNKIVKPPLDLFASYAQFGGGGGGASEFTGQKGLEENGEYWDFLLYTFTSQMAQQASANFNLFFSIDEPTIVDLSGSLSAYNDASAAYTLSGQDISWSDQLHSASNTKEATMVLSPGNYSLTMSTNSTYHHPGLKAETSDDIKITYRAVSVPEPAIFILLSFSILGLAGIGAMKKPNHII
jgi:hypothetical protein